MSAGIVALSCPTLYNSLDWSPPGSSVHGILQERMQEWVAMPFSRGSSLPRDRTCISCVSCIADGFFTCWNIRKAQSWGRSQQNYSSAQKHALGWLEGKVKHDADEKNTSSETKRELILQEYLFKKGLIYSNIERTGYQIHLSHY